MGKHTHCYKSFTQSPWNTAILWNVVPLGLRTQATVSKLRPKQAKVWVPGCWLIITRRPREDGISQAGTENRVLQQQDGRSWDGHMKVSGCVNLGSCRDE